MSEDKDLEQRLNDMESHLAHQEKTIQDLSDIAARQWETIDGLVRKVGRLEDRIRVIEEDIQTTPPKDPPPPHY